MISIKLKSFKQFLKGLYDKPRQHIKSRDIALPTNVHIVKAMVFPVVMYRYESWTIKKAEGWRIGAFQLWYWRRLLRVPWTARGSSQSILKEINSKHSLEGLMLELKLQYFGHLMWRTDSLEQIPMLGKIEGKSGKGWQSMRWLEASPTQWHEFEQTPGDSEGQMSRWAAVHGVVNIWTWFSDWTTKRLYQKDGN